MRTRNVEFTVCGKGGQPEPLLADLMVASMGRVAVVLDFGDDHVVDDLGEVYCNGGPGTIIKTGIRIIKGAVFGLYFGKQFTFDEGKTSGPGAVCKMCGRVAKIVQFTPEGPDMELARIAYPHGSPRRQ